MNLIVPVITYLRSLTFGGLFGSGIGALISHYYFPGAPINYSLVIGGVVGSGLHSTLKGLINRIITDREVELFRKLILLILSYRTWDRAIISIIKKILILEYVLSDRVEATKMADQLCDLIKQRDFELLLRSEHDKQERLQMELDKFKLRVDKERLEEERKQINEAILRKQPPKTQATKHDVTDGESNELDRITEPAVGDSFEDGAPKRPEVKSGN